MKPNRLIIYLILLLGTGTSKLSGSSVFFNEKYYNTKDTTSIPIDSSAYNKPETKRNLTKKILGYMTISSKQQVGDPLQKSVTYFEPFKNKKIASIYFKRLHPFGPTLEDTTLIGKTWIMRTGNRLHMNTAKSKLRMLLLFKEGETVNPLLMAENEKIIRDLPYIEDVAILLENVEGSPEQVKVTVISKDRFEYGFGLNATSSHIDLELYNENMFGLGHQLIVGVSEKNAYFPNMGGYASYNIKNIYGRYINATVGYTDTYRKKGFNFLVEKKYLTSEDKNAGGLKFERTYMYNYISEDQPYKLDTTLSYLTSDAWYSHSFKNKTKLFNKAYLGFRYLHHQNYPFDQSKLEGNEFYRNHDFFLASFGLSERDLHKNNLVYGYGITEDIPTGNYYSVTTGLDKSQYGIWPYFGLSFSNSFVGNKGGYYFFKTAVDGYINDRKLKQGTINLKTTLFTRKIFIQNSPYRQFLNIELMNGINRFNEEYLTINDRFGIRGFYTRELVGTSRLNVKLETVKYMKWNYLGFKFATYLFSDFSFLSNRFDMILKDKFYAGLGGGIRIHNETLVFKVFEIRLTWFPIIPPEGIFPIAATFPGQPKGVFEDFMGRKPDFIRFQ